MSSGLLTKGWKGIFLRTFVDPSVNQTTHQATTLTWLSAYGVLPLLKVSHVAACNGERKRQQSVLIKLNTSTKLDPN